MRNSSDKSIAKSKNCFQLLGKGTSVSFTIYQTSRLLPDPFRKDLVPAFIEFLVSIEYDIDTCTGLFQITETN